VRQGDARIAICTGLGVDADGLEFPGPGPCQGRDSTLMLLGAACMCHLRLFAWPNCIRYQSRNAFEFITARHLVVFINPISHFE